MSFVSGLAVTKEGATKDHIEAGRRAPQTGAGGLAARLAAGDERDHTFAGETQGSRDRVF